MSYTIYHNPACGTSRKVMGILKQAGIEPEIVEYLKAPPTRKQMAALLRDMKLSPRQIIRRKGNIYKELNLSDETLSDARLLDALEQNPVLMERPIVVSPKGTRICRPADVVLDLLPD